MPNDGNRTWNRFALVLVLLFLLSVPGLHAVVQPEGKSLDKLAYAHPDLFRPSDARSLDRLPAPLAERLREDLRILARGRDGGAIRILAAGQMEIPVALYSMRAGRWESLLLSRPLIPGTGVGNDLTWSGIRVARPPDDEQLKKAVWEAFASYLAEFRDQLGIDLGELSATPNISIHENGRLIQIHAPRLIKGVPVRDSYVNAVVNSGNLVLFGSRNFGKIEISTEPSLSQRDAIAAVERYLESSGEVAGIAGFWRRPRLEILSMVRGADPDGALIGQGYAYRLAWVVSPRIEGDSGSWEALVDAASGEFLAFSDTNQYADQKKIVGGVFPVSNDGLSLGGVPDGIEQPGYPMSRAFVRDANGNELTANSEGLVAVDGEYSTDLTGPFVRIVDNCGFVDESTTCTALDLATSSGTDCVVPAGHSAGDTHSSRTGFYELNRLIDQAKTWMSPTAQANLPTGWLNRQMPANMNINNACNAFFSPADTGEPTTGSINFYRQGSLGTNVCRNTGEIPAVFDHEWGHGLDTFDNSAGVSSPGEAYADMTAVMRLNQSCIARGFFISNTTGGFCPGNGDPCTECTGVREIDWKKRLSGKPHDLAWVLGQNTSIPGSCPVVAPTTPPTPFNSGPCQRSTHCEGNIIGEAVWDLLKRDLPCHTKRWVDSPGTVGGGQCTNGQAPTIDENSALVLATRLFYVAGGGVVEGYQCQVDTAGCNSTSWYLNFLAADDDDGSILNGSPHMVAISDAFTRHGIACAAPLAMNLGCLATAAPMGKATVTATAGTRSAEIRWSNVQGAAEYWVLRTNGVHGCDTGKTRVARIPGNGQRIFTEAGLLDGLTYYYSVVAVGGAGNVPVDSCTGPMSDCAAVTPTAPTTLSAAAAAIQQSDAPPVIETGDGDPFVDNCETARLTFNVNNIGGVTLTGLRVTAIQPTNNQTTVLTPLPIQLPNLAAGCGTPSATTAATFRFTAGGASSQSSLSFNVTVMANELPGPVSGTLTINDVETDLVLGDVAYDFESGTQGWTVFSGTFDRVSAPGSGAGAEGTDSFMKSSSAVDNACDRVRSPKVRLTSSSTLSLYNQFDTETEVDPDAGLPFYDRGNVGIINEQGQRSIISPDGGRLYNATNTYTGCNSGPGWATSVDNPVNPFAQSTWSSAAFGAASYAGQQIQVEVSYGTDALNSRAGLQFDQVRITNVLVEVPDQQSDVCPKPDLVVTSIVANNNRNIREGDKVTIKATVANTGTAPAGSSTTEFLLDNVTILGMVGTPPIPAGGSVDVSVQWDTRSQKGQHMIKVTADAPGPGAVAESNEFNNSSTVTVTVQGNKVKNSSFQQSNSTGDGPDGWSGFSTGAGSATWTDGGSDGDKSAATTGNGGNAATSGSPSWTSDPITVTPGEALTFVVSISSVNASSAATAGLAYLGAAGNLLQTVNLITAPLTTTGFSKLEQAVTIPAGVAQVRVTLVGFAPTDLRTSGTVKFDEVGLFGD